MQCPVLSGRGFDAAIAVLPPGHPSLPVPPPLPTFTLESLQQANEAKAQRDEKRNDGGEAVVASSFSTNQKQTLPPCLAVKGAILDVSNEARCAPGGVWHSALGKDLTRTLAFTPIPHQLAVAAGLVPSNARDGEADQPSSENDAQERSASVAASATVPSVSADWPLHLEAAHQGACALEGLTFDQLRSLETWTSYLLKHCPTIGRLLTEHEQNNRAADGQTLMTLPGEAHMAPLPSDIYGSFLPLVEQTAAGASASASSGSAVVNLHALIDVDQREECRQAVLSLPLHSALFESGCHRSGMTALHRAVENDWPDVVKALLSRGADPQAKCALYDGDTALQLARRFQAMECVALLEVAANHNSAAAEPSAPAAQ